MDHATARKIAKLARIRLTDDEVPAVANQLASILHWIEQLREVDTDNVPEMTSVADLALPWREDVITDGHQQAAIVKNAPESAHGCFAVPKVIE